ncbi:MAG: hypothetical protein QOF11_1364 [Chloroflexota bacterium]|jgi:hypothetical protein|nr:hypothetical protein [Chloroflexota bacterium]
MRLHLFPLASAPVPGIAMTLNHHGGPHTPLEWAIYLVVAAVLVGVVVAVIRQKDPR